MSFNLTAPPTDVAQVLIASHPCWFSTSKCTFRGERVGWSCGTWTTHIDTLPLCEKSYIYQCVARLWRDVTACRCRRQPRTPVTPIDCRSTMPDSRLCWLRNICHSRLVNYEPWTPFSVSSRNLSLTYLFVAASDDVEDVTCNVTFQASNRGLSCLVAI